MNGRQLAEEARRRRPDLRALFTTGYARNAIVHDGRPDPGVELITKPYSQAALSTKLRDMLDASGGPNRNLLVEDEPLIQMLAVDFLEHAALKVDTAGTAREALNKLALVSGGYTAVIVDIGLPDRSGDDLVREIRSLHSSLPIIVATGKGARDVGNIFDGAKHIAFLGKPYIAEDLYNAPSSQCRRSSKSWLPPNSRGRLNSPVPLTQWQLVASSYPHASVFAGASALYIRKQ